MDINANGKHCDFLVEDIEGKEEKDGENLLINSSRGKGEKGRAGPTHAYKTYRVIHKDCDL